jgi:hypothetical protein
MGRSLTAKICFSLPIDDIYSFYGKKYFHKSIWTEEISLWDTFYKLFSSFLNSKSISVNNFRLPDTFRTYFKMFICKKSIWGTNCMSLDTFGNFIMLNSSTNRRNSQISWAEVKCNDRRIRPVAVRLWGRSPSRRLSQSLTGTWTSRREWSVGVKGIWEFLHTLIKSSNPNLGITHLKNLSLKSLGWYIRHLKRLLKLWRCHSGVF